MNQHGDNTLLEAALRYAAEGIIVFPTRPDKKPYILDWGNAASANADQIRKWWKRWPSAGIAMPTGDRTGRLVIDLDPRHGADQSVAVMEEEYGPLPPTLEVETGGGGRHLHFQLRGLDIHNSAGELAPGVDVRGVGGYVILPPSFHPNGNRYGWANGNEILDLPLWLEKALLSIKKPTMAASPNGNGRKIAAGKRNSELTKRAGAYRRKGDTPEMIFQKLVVDNAQCDPPLSEQELRSIANSVGRYAPAEEVTGPPKAQIPPPVSPSEPAEEPESAPGRVPITEESNAERLVRKHGDDLRYAYDRGVWCAWHGKLWCVDDAGEVMRRMGEVTRGIYGEAANELDELLRKALAKWAQKSESCHVQKSSVELAEHIHGIEVREFRTVFDTHPGLVSVENGTIEFQERTT